jgi:hypothetical protein
MLDNPQLQIGRVYADASTELRRRNFTSPDCSPERSVAKADTFGRLGNSE